MSVQTNPMQHAAPAIAAVDKELQRLVTAPIPPTQLREYFTNNKIQFVIDYKNSRLKGTTLLSYLTNLDMPSDILVDLESYESYSILLKAYITQQGIVHCNSLAALAGEVIMHFATIPKEEWGFISPVPVEWLQRFCEENEDTLATWSLFLNSMVTFMGKVTMKLEFNDNEQLLVVDDRTVVGQNVVNLLRIPDYLCRYFAHANLSAQAYFKAQFETAMFSGHDLGYYFFSPGNTAVNLVNSSFPKLAQSEIGMQVFQYLQQLNQEEKA